MATSITNTSISTDTINVDNGVLYVDNVNNRVGIGTNTPQNALHLHNSANNYYNIQFTNSDSGQSSATSGVRAGIASDENFYIVQGDDTKQMRLAIGSDYDSITLEYNANKLNSRVGINTSTPDNELDVNGDAKIQGHLILTNTMRSVPSAEYLFVQQRGAGYVRFDISEEFKTTGYFGLSDYTTTYTDPYNVYGGSSQDSAITFSPDGTRVWFSNFGVFYQHDLPTPYDLTSVTSQSSTTFQLYNRNNSSSCYGTGITWVQGGKYAWFGYGEWCQYAHPGTQDTYSLYSASTPYDISSLTLVKHTTMSTVNSAQGTSTPEFNNTGTKAYVGCRGGTDAYKLFQFNLTVPFDLATAHTTSVYTSPSFYDHISLRIDRNGEYIYTGCHSPDVIVQYKMTTPWDITTAVVIQQLETNVPTSQAFNGIYLAEPGYY